MKLRDVKPKLRTMSSFEEAPDIIVLHCGGNDLGQHSIRISVNWQNPSCSMVGSFIPILWGPIV
jgi:hypothetical protein